MHDVAFTHATAAKRASTPLGGTGVVWMVHAVPFHRSANNATVPARFCVDAPTAVHAVGDVHETPNNRLDGTPAGAGMVMTVQEAPSQRSAKGAFDTPSLNRRAPMAMHAFAAEHDTESSADP